MKSSLIVGAAALAFAVACTHSPSENSSSSDSTSTTTVAQAIPVNVIIWTEVGLRDSPDEGKFVTTAYIGEHFELTGDTATRAVSGKTHKFHKIKLTDGKMGWVRDEFLAIDVYPAAVVGMSEVYKRPDITTVTPKYFSTGDYLVVRKKDTEFVEVIGKTLDDKWFSSGYVLERNLSYEEIDIRFAAMLQRARDEKKEATQTMLFDQVRSEDVFGASQLWRIMYGPADEGTGMLEDTIEDQDEEDAGFGVMQMPLGEPLEGILAHYLMDHAELFDNSGNNQDGMSYNTGFDHDKVGASMSALTFNGLSSYGTVTWKGEPIKPPFTVVAYVKLGDLVQRSQTVVSKGRSKDGTGFNFGYSVNDNSQRVYYLGMIGVDRPIGVEALAEEPAGQWVYLAASFDMKTAKIYVDGELKGTTPVSDTDAQAIYDNLANSDQPLEIGRELASLGRYFKGSIDHVALWNRALTDEEIADMNR